MIIQDPICRTWARINPRFLIKYYYTRSNMQDMNQDQSTLPDQILLYKIQYGKHEPGSIHASWSNMIIQDPICRTWTRINPRFLIKYYYTRSNMENMGQDQSTNEETLWWTQSDDYFLEKYAIDFYSTRGKPWQNWEHRLQNFDQTWIDKNEDVRLRNQALWFTNMIPKKFFFTK